MVKVWVDLVTGPIPGDQLSEFVRGDPGLGGVVTFEGITRTGTDPQHGQLSHLDYEAYGPMARQQLQRLAEQAAERFGARRIVLLHRLGSVRPGETSVSIAVACPHRAEAFAACRWLIDTLKCEVPIWKKDVFEDGFERWVERDNANCQLPIANWNREERDG